MKTNILFALFILFSITHSIFGQSSNRNYVLTITPTVASTTSSGLTTDQSLQTIQYFDGLGRPVQTIQKMAGVGSVKPDLVTYQEYDVCGRVSNNWLPSVASGNNGTFISLSTFMNKSSATYSDSKAYSKPVYEASPLSRVLEEYGPGQSWHNNSGSMKSSYLTNVSGVDTLNCIYYTATISTTDTLLTLSRVKNYDTGTLFVTRMQGENGYTSFEFKNKLDQVILTRQIQRNGSSKVLHDTYYIYDDFGNLAIVLPPAASDAFKTGSNWNSKIDATLKNYAYLYKYDGRHRCTGKKLPGCSWIYYIYDKANHLIFSQDGEQRIRKEWLFTLSDIFDRPCVSGICSNTNLNGLTGVALTTNVAVARDNSTTAYKGYSLSGVTLTSPKLLSVNYYDDYTFMNKSCIPEFNNANYAYVADSNYDICNTTNLKGLLTGSIVARINNTTTFSYQGSVMYYDYRQRMIQSLSGNHLGGLDKEYVAYNFSGQPIRHRQVHSAMNKSTLIEDYVYSYDHGGRLLKTTHQLTEVTTAGVRTVKPLIVLVENGYDNLGRLSSTTPNNQSYLKTSYTYNVRSWTERISSSHFWENLAYSYNGNINTQEWGQTGKTRKYTFAYDDLSRLKSSSYTGDAAYGTMYNYDKHGNITNLLRYGNTGTSTTGIIDNLEMNYIGNQLIKVEDSGVVPSLSSSADFRNGSTADIEYYYDTNGNMKKDLNKGISSIEYNSLNLPKSLVINNSLGSATNVYTYTADGTKLNVSKGSLKTDYVGNVIYENGSFKRLLVDGGYYEGGMYYFYIRDHLGNNRIVANQNGGVVQSTQYYPFGMAFADGTGQSIQPYKYNGKELDGDRGLNLYDYSARYTDGTLGRFTMVDPLAENRPWESPYAFCGGNPVNRIDPNGLHWVTDKDDKIIWNNDAISAETTPEGYTYIGKTANGTNADGNYIYYAQDGRTYDSAPLPEVNVTASMPSHIKDMQAASYLNIYSGTEAFMSHPVTMMVSISTALPGAIEGFGAIASGARSLFNVAKGLVRNGSSAGRGAVTALKPLDLGSTGRTSATSLTEQLAMKEALSNPLVGQIIPKMKPLSDPRWSGWMKMQYTHTGLNGNKTVIHYNGKWVNGVLKAVDDFKFK